MRQQIAAANWKMNLTLPEGEQLVKTLIQANIPLKNHQRVLIGVPFPYLVPLQSLVKDIHGFDLMAQNCAATLNGAYTGEVSATMLKSLGIQWAIIGHSERREYQMESNALLAQKTDRLLEHDLYPVFCCGEPLQIREAGTHNSYVETQLKESLFHLSEEALRRIVIAYEPIWAIGTGKTATTEQAQEMHKHIRSVLEKQYGTTLANMVPVLYGGSVKANNASELFGQPDVDGGLVGGASLVADDFAAIIRSLKA